MRDNDFSPSSLYELDRSRRSPTPPPDLILKDEEGENNTVKALRRYIYRPGQIQSPPSNFSYEDVSELPSPVPRLLPSLIADSGDESMDVDEAPTPEPFEAWPAPDPAARSMPPPPVPKAKALADATMPVQSPLRRDGSAPPRPLAPKRRLTYPGSPPRARRPLGAKSMSVNLAKPVSSTVVELRLVTTRKTKPERKAQRLRQTHPISLASHGKTPQGSPFSKRLNLNLRSEGRRTQTILHLVGQHLARTEHFAQLAALVLVSRSAVPLLYPLLLRTVHLTHTNLASFLGTFVKAGPADIGKRVKRNRDVRRVLGVKCIVIHSVPEHAPWPAALLGDTLTDARRVIVRCPLGGSLMQRTIALLASPEQVCLDARAVDGPNALSFALCVLPRWADLQELTIHAASALQSSKVLTGLQARSYGTPGEYRSQLTSMFERKGVMYTLDFGEDGDDAEESATAGNEVRPVPVVPAVGSGTLGASQLPAFDDPWYRFFSALNVVDALSVNVIVPHRGRQSLPAPSGGDAVKHALRAKRRGWSFARIEDTKVRCACGRSVA